VKLIEKSGQKPVEDLNDLFVYGHPDMEDDDDETDDDYDNSDEIDNSATPETTGITEMEFSRMKPFPNHVFQLYSGKRLEDLVDSIKRIGISTPLVVWHTENDEYIILSGHNRVNAGKLAGLTTSPVYIRKNLTYDDAVFIVTETNLNQRSFSDMLHSERALCLSQHYEAMKHQGKRIELIKEIETLTNVHYNSDLGSCSQVENKRKSLSKVGEEYGFSKDKVARYIRLSTLIPDLLEYTDTGEIAFLAAYDISFIEDNDLQSLIAAQIKNNGYKVDMKTASLLREHYKAGQLTETKIEQILSGDSTRKPKSDKPKPFQLKRTVIEKHFTNGQSKTEIADIIDRALTQYFSQNVTA
jgi:ParB family chromosome partitioning protein